MPPSVLGATGVHWVAMVEFAFILAGYVALLFVFRIVGGIGAAADALESWGARASAKRRGRVERRLGIR
jgi:hypothetical protein